MGQIKSKPTWKVKHANSILESFEYFCQISSKLIVTILSYTVSNLVRFLRHSVDKQRLRIRLGLGMEERWRTEKEGMGRERIGITFWSYKLCLRSRDPTHAPFLQISIVLTSNFNGSYISCESYFRRFLVLSGP